MPPDVELSTWSQITGYAVCEALDDGGIGYSCNYDNPDTFFIHIKYGNMLSTQIVVSSHGHDVGGDIQLSLSNNHTNLMYNFINNENMADPKNDPTKCCNAIVESIKYFNKAQDALFDLIQKTKDIIWYFDHNINNQMDHWVCVTGNITDEEAIELLAESKIRIRSDAEHALYQFSCHGINGVLLSEFFDDIDSVCYDEITNIIIKFIEHSPGTRKFILDGEME